MRGSTPVAAAAGWNPSLDSSNPSSHPGIVQGRPTQEARPLCECSPVGSSLLLRLDRPRPARPCSRRWGSWQPWLRTRHVWLCDFIFCLHTYRLWVVCFFFLFVSVGFVCWLAYLCCLEHIAHSSVQYPPHMANAYPYKHWEIVFVNSRIPTSVFR